MPWGKVDQLCRSAFACIRQKKGFVCVNQKQRNDHFCSSSFSQYHPPAWRVFVPYSFAPRFCTSNVKCHTRIVQDLMAFNATSKLNYGLETYKRFCKSFYSVYVCKAVSVLSLHHRKGQVVLRCLAYSVGSFCIMGYKIALAEEPSYRWSFSNHLGSSSNNLLLSHTDNQSTKMSVMKQTVETLVLVLRAVFLAALFTPALVLGLFAEKLGGQVRVMWLYILLKTLEFAGPAFIKWGQWAATRPDIFPPDICKQLAKLHSQAPAHSFRQTKKIIERAFRMPIEDVFEDFSEEPIASGSIAQVHKAVLKEQGARNRKPVVVAVKVRHPSVSKVIQRDFEIMNWIAKISTSVPGLSHLQLDKTVQQFATFMTKQVDLTLEAAHLMRFIYNFRQWKNVTFPRPIYPFVHPEVLVETFEEGDCIANIIDSEPRTQLHKQLAHLGTSILLKMLLMDNFIHGDLHPGNMFVKFEGGVPKVVLLDVGMTAELNQRNRYILLELFKALAEMDGAKVARCALDFSEEQSCTDPEAFINDVDTIFKSYMTVRGTTKMADYISTLFDQVRRYRVNLDAEVSTVMVTVVILEGWQRKLDLSLDILDMINTLLFKAEWAASYEYVMSAIVAP